MSLTFDEFIAGWVGGIVGLIGSHPIDTLKVRKQEGILRTDHFLVSTYRQEGIYGFYKGMTVPAMMSGIQNAVFFGVYANILNSLSKTDKQRIIVNNRDVIEIFLAGCGGGIFQILFTTPVERIKIQLQTKKRQGVTDNTHRGTLRNYILETYRTQGIRKGFYRGFLCTALRDVPTGGFYILTYDVVDVWLTERTNAYLSHCIAGGLAGFATYAPVTPIDVIKTKLQSDDMNDPKFRSTLDCIRKTYKSDGIPVFWRGFIPVCVRAFVCNAFIFVGYEYCISLIDRLKK